MLNIKQIVVLCGGSGSRLGNVTKEIPKPMLMVRGVPYLDLLVQELAQFPVDEIVLLAGYKGETIRNHLDDKIVNGVKIKVLIEDQPRGTLGALLYHSDQLKEQFIVCNADTMWTYKIIDFYQALKVLDKNFSYIFTTIPKNENRYGNIMIEGDFIRDFEEKENKIAVNLINSGIYVLKKEHLLDLPFLEITKKLDLEAHCFKLLASKGLLKCVNNIIIDFFDFGTPASFRELSDQVLIKFSKKIIFLDRDNTINHDNGYISYPSKVVICESFLEICDELSGSNRFLVVISNQGGIAKEKFLETDNIKFYKQIKIKLAEYGVFLFDYLYCPHHPSVSHCLCRKPETELIDNWKFREIMDMRSMSVIGDSIADGGFAENLGAKYIRATCNKSYKEKLRYELHVNNKNTT